MQNTRPQEHIRRRATLWRRIWLKSRRVARKILGERDSATKIARGVSAGFLAAAFPLPGLQIPLSLLFAWAMKGNKAVSVFPQFISNAGTMVPLAILQFKVGAFFWPGGSSAAMANLQQAAGQWGALSTWEFLKAMAQAMGQLGLAGLGPMAIGVALTGAAMAIASYPLTVACVWAWRTGRRRRRWARWGHKTHARPLTLRHAEAPPSRQEALEYCRRPGHFRLASDARLLVNGGEAFAQMISAIQYAGKSVDLESYMLEDDNTGRRFGQALIEAARRGLRVRLLYDWVGSMGLGHAFIKPLLDAGVEVRVYHPLVLMRPSWAVNRRDHRKILVVDRKIGFTGGLNLSDEYAAKEDGGEGWRDTHVRLSGKPVADALERLFLQGWKAATPYDRSRSPSGRLKMGLKHLGPKRIRSWASSEEELRALLTGQGVPVQILGNAEFRHRRRIHRAYLYAIHQARRYILIENAYFIPDRSIRRALRRAVKRGVTVAVAVARTSDVATAAYATRSLYSELFGSGVRVFEWPLGMLHAKTAVIDDAWSIVGSYNFDHRSLFHQLEAVAVVADPEFCVRLRDQTLADMAQCKEVSAFEHELRPWTKMILESLAYLLKHWL